MRLEGNCHCGNISFSLEWGSEPEHIPARACDCTFCTKHGGVWTSSPVGSLLVRIADAGAVSQYSFGTKTAQFHVCGRCGVVPVVTSEVDGSYVRRSVANNLNDIGKDHPGRLIATARRWLRGASPERRWIVERALRSRVKACDPEALALLGYAGGTALALVEPRIAPRRVKAGASVAIGFQVLNGGARPERMLADFRVHFVKAGGRTAPKVFKLKTATLAPGQALRVGKSVSLAPMTTRRHHPGRHAVEALVNGKAYALGHFDVVA